MMNPRGLAGKTEEEPLVSLISEVWERSHDLPLLKRTPYNLATVAAGTCNKEPGLKG